MMDAELEAYDRVWNETPRDERNAVCQALADAYVAAHPEVAAELGLFTIPELVALVEVARAAGNEERRIYLDMWINAAFEYQRIGGDSTVDGVLRHPLPDIDQAGTRRTVPGG